MLGTLILFGKEIGMGYLNDLSFDKLGEILSYQPSSPMLFSSGLFFVLFFFLSSFYILFRKHTFDICDVVLPLFLLQEQWHLVWIVGFYGYVRFFYRPLNQPSK